MTEKLSEFPTLLIYNQTLVISYILEEINNTNSCNLYIYTCSTFYLSYFDLLFLGGEERGGEERLVKYREVTS